MTDIRLWDPVAGGNVDPPPDGYPEDELPSTINNCAREVMASIRRWFEDGGWADFNHVITFVSPVEFTTPGDVAGIYKTNRRIRITGTATTTVFATVTSSVVISNVTTVQYAVDSGLVADEALQVSLGIDPLGTPFKSSVPPGTVMLMTDAACPLGWILNTDLNDLAVRVNIAGGGTTGGDWVITGLSNSNTGSTTLTAAQTGIAAHTHLKDGHEIINRNLGGAGNETGTQNVNNEATQSATESAAQGHVHPGSVIVSAGTWRPAFLDAVMCSKDEVTVFDPFVFPEGIIFPFTSNGALPPGWTRFTAADDRFVVGAGDTYLVGETGGSDTITFSSVVAGNSSHTGSTIGGAESHLTTGAGGAPSVNERTLVDVVSHNHPFSASGVAVDSHRDYILIQADGVKNELPFSASAIDVDNTLDHTDMFQVDGVGFLFMSSGDTYGVDSGSITADIPYDLAIDGDHNHHVDGVLATGGAANQLDNAGGHVHTGTLRGTLATKTFLIELWASAAGAIELRSRMVAMWESATPPAGWSLCDGGGGRPDLRDFFVKVGQHGSSSGDNIVAFSSIAQSTAGAHAHGVSASEGPGADIFHSISGGDHSDHAISGSGLTKTVLPPFYALTFIMKD